MVHRVPSSGAMLTSGIEGFLELPVGERLQYMWRGVRVLGEG